MNIDWRAAEAEVAQWTCRYCGHADGFRLTRWRAAPLGSFSLAGVGMKAPATEHPAARCQPDRGGCGRPMEDIRLLAYLLHAGQVDKQGRPYYEHPAVVEATVKACGGTVYQRAAALLHDVVEDGRATLGELREAGVPSLALVLVDALTRRPGETYSEYIERLLGTPEAVPVKEADLDHNQGRLDGIADPAVRGRLDHRYRRARTQIAVWRAAQASAADDSP